MSSSSKKGQTKAGDWVTFLAADGNEKTGKVEEVNGVKIKARTSAGILWRTTSDCLIKSESVITEN
ncbi:MAG TPA: hypothetical protein VGQ59_11900 [Cyclobacteriaceae bacterium]|jgi:hypothetical protein|nr:hypothetical protein [Cyclobacteriaceae bacterium]